MSRVAVFFLLAAGGWSQTPTPAAGPRRLTLEEAEALAVKQNPQVSGALLNALAANQVTLQWKSLYLPQITGAVSAVGGEMDTRIAAGALSASTVYNRFAAGIAVTQLVTDFGRTGLQVDAAKLRAQAFSQGAAAVRSLILLQVRRAFLSALRARAVLGVAEQTVAARQLVADQVAALAQSNLKSGLDVSFANVNLAESKLLLSQARNEVRALHAELSNALGFREPQEFEPVETVMPVPPDLEPAPMIATALRERPDVLSLRSDHSAAEKTAASEAALWRPTVTAQAATGASPAHEQKLSDHYSVAGVNVSIPVFNGKLFSARRSEAELRAKAAAERLRDLETRVARDVQVAWLSATNAFERVTLTGELLKQASLALELAQARYDLGLSSIVELSQAQLAKTSADLQNASARYEFQIQTSLLSYQEGLLK